MIRKELIDFCLTFSNSYEDYPFKGDVWTLIRHSSNKKSFANIFERNGKLCVNLKCEPMRADFLRSVFPAVTPAYHMNKTHWNTVLVNEISLAELNGMILHSYELTLK
ncbi:MAG: MmcQ/YjbR family DNA-binding protein [Oscillospiraceae bacterium]